MCEMCLWGVVFACVCVVLSSLDILHDCIFPYLHVTAYNLSSKLKLLLRLLQEPGTFYTNNFNIRKTPMNIYSLILKLDQLYWFGSQSTFCNCMYVWCSNT